MNAKPEVPFAGPEIGPQTDIDLTAEEMAAIDLRAAGTILLNRAIALSRAVNDQLLEPIARWLDDPKWLEKFRDHGDQRYNWIGYKQKQRSWSRQQKLLSAERLKLYWQEIHKKRLLRRELAEIHGCPTQPIQAGYESVKTDFLQGLVEPFSSKARTQTETKEQFDMLRVVIVTSLLPWKLLLTSELTESDDDRKIFTNLAIHVPENKKRERAAKIQALLHMQTEGTVELSQEKHLAPISIRLKEDPLDLNLTIKDLHGRNYQFDWLDLTPLQRSRVLQDIKEHRIICKT